MSSEVFPDFPGLQLDPSPESFYRTQVYPSPGGTEQRVSRMPSARRRWRLRGSLRNDVAAPSPYQARCEIDCLRDFIDRHRGSGDSFLFSDPADFGRTNLFAYSEPLLANIPSKSAGITQGALTDGGLSNGATFPAAAQADNAFEQPTLASGTSYLLSVFVKMADLSAPVVGLTNATGDFGLYSDGALHQSAVITANLGGNLYRVSSVRTATVGGVRDCGVVRYVGQSGKGFTVSGWQIEPSTPTEVPLAYARTSGAAFSRQYRVRFAADAQPLARPVWDWFDATIELVSVLGES